MTDRRLQKVLWLVAAVLFAALIATGWLQFRFIDELHAAESGSRRANLQAGLEAFREAFDAEILSWQLRIKVAASAIDDSAEPPEITASDWLSLKGSDLLAELWVDAYFRDIGEDATWWPLRESQSGSPSGSESEPGSSIDQASSPARAQGLDAVLETQMSAPVIFDEQTLALLVQFGTPAFEELTAAAAIRPKSLVILLDRELFIDRLIDPLARRHLPYSGDAFDYIISMSAEGEAHSMLYATISDFDWQDLPPADAEVQLLSSRNQAAALLNRSQDRLEATGGPCGSDVAGTGAGPQCTDSADVIRADPSAVVFIRSGDGPDWTLSARSRSGSLEAAIDGLRRRNLITSLLSLTVLAACLGLLGLLALRAERLARSQLTFIAGVSHDLRTPLSVIQQAAANLGDGVIHEKEAVRGYGDLVRQEAKRLQEMIERILTFSGLGTQRLPLAAVDLEPLVERVVGQMSLDIEEKGLKVSRDLPASLPAVRANEAALESALQNLLSNALKYGSDGGRVQIDARLEEHLGQKEIRVGVRDWGPGIEPSDRRHLFDPFFRGRRAREGRQPGTGLGLSLVARVAQTLGGRVRFEAPVGGGSAFHLHLPAALES